MVANGREMDQFYKVLPVLAATLAIIVAAEPNCSQPPPRANIMQCCSNQALLAEVGEKCTAKMPASPDRNPMMGFCFGECIFNETGLAVNGQVQMDKAKAILTEKFKNAPEFVPIMEQALKKCEQSANEKISAGKVQGRPPPQGMICNPKPALIASCTMLETFINCPSSRWQNNEACNNVKQFFVSCPMPPPPPRP